MNFDIKSISSWAFRRGHELELSDRETQPMAGYKIMMTSFDYKARKLNINGTELSPGILHKVKISGDKINKTLNLTKLLQHDTCRNS